MADCGEGSIKMVDNLLDILTGGEHSKTAALIEEVSNDPCMHHTI